MSGRARAAGRALAGPATIVVAVLIVLHDFAFGGVLPSQHMDVLGFWLPHHCLLGQSLAAGDIPQWNPHVLAGVPLAADPQSGWMYLPVMLMYTVLPCEAALPTFIVLQPILAGLGLYWFLRSEGLSRLAATVAGLSLALAISASRTAVSLPFAGSLAWSTVLLALASRALRATTWSSRIVWVTAAALAWGQLAAAHLSHGLVIGTAAVLVFGAARSVADVRAGRRSAQQCLALGILFLALLVPVNLASLLPRFGYLSRSTLDLGYEGLGELTRRLSDHFPPPVITRATGGYSWPLILSASPGAAFGAAPLILSFAALWSRRRRSLAIAATVVGAGSYLLSLPGTARLLSVVARVLPFGDVYLHAPSRFRYGLLLAIPLLSAVGLEAWQDLGRGRRRPIILALGISVWVLLPLAVGIHASYLGVIAVGTILTLAVLRASSRRPVVLVALPLLLAAELVTGALIGQESSRILPAARTTAFETLLEPSVDPHAYLREGTLARAIRLGGGGRYVTLKPDHEGSKGYVGRWHPEDAPSLDNQRSMLLGLEDVQGYNPVQPVRLWSYNRLVSPAPPKTTYNFTEFHKLPPGAVDLLQVRWVVAARGAAVAEFEPLLSEGGWTLFRGPERARASLVGSWSVVSSADRALFEVASEGFDPHNRVVLEQDPGLPSPRDASEPSRVVYRPLGPEAASVTTDTPAPGVLLVRTGWDPHWRATVDGREAPVLVGNGFLQAIPVPAGRHLVELRYHDSSIGIGLAGSAVTLLALVAAATLARRRREPSEARRDPDGDSAPRPTGPSPPSREARPGGAGPLR